MARLAVCGRSSVLLLLGLAGCKDRPTEVQAGPPDRVEVTSGRVFTGVVGTRVGTPLGVRVVDEQGRPVSGAIVRFAIIEGPGFLDPQSALTGRAGDAQTTLTLGAQTGTYRVYATVRGATSFGVFVGEANPGAVTRLVVTPGQVRLAAVGDTVRLRARQYDHFGNVVPASPVAWTAADPDVFTIDPDGLVTGSRALATGRAVASATGRADTAFVVVANPDETPCLGYSPRVTLAVGQAIDVSMTDGACIASAAAGDEYVLIPWSGSTAGGSEVAIRVTGVGLGAVTESQALAPAAGGLSWARVNARAQSTDPAPSFVLEHRIREAGRREVMPLVRRLRAGSSSLMPSLSRTAAIPASISLGDLVELNADARSSCASPSRRTGRITAISSRAVVVHDTANPVGGFTDADYQRFAVTFDTLVAPVDEAAFGTPTDIDQNGKIVIFFTRAVNELTPAGSLFYYGGFFHPRDLLPRQQRGVDVCAASNEAEMVYMLVPDPTGVVNGNARRVGFVDSVTVVTLAHEYQHLINAGRRAYVNNSVVDEEVWLNEGLSHIAEELVFYRASGAAPRQNISGSNFGTEPYNGLFIQYIALNFGRLRAFLEAPQRASPYSGEDLAARGAAWAFLRYAADRRGSGDGDVWMRLANSTTAGLHNLQAVFGRDVGAMIRDWTISLYTDDYVDGVAGAYTQPSWNFRTAFPVAPISPGPYPLVNAVRRMSDGTSHLVTLRGGAGAFLRFAVTPGREAAIRLTSGGIVPPPTVRATIVRRR